MIELPRPPAADDVIGLNIVAGPLPAGARIRISTADGAYVGTVAAFPPGAATGRTRHQMAVPGGAATGARLALIATLVDPAAPAPRAPRPAELIAITAAIQPE